MEWWQGLILIIASAVAFRFAIRFDLNRYLENRRRIKLDQLKNICPHCKIEILDKNQVKVESYFSSPIGTSNWICSRCHQVVESEDKVNKISEYHAKHPDVFLEKENRFQKKVKKLGLI